MEVDFTKAFNKQFEKLPQKSQEKAKAAMGLFLEDSAHPRLRCHSLKGEWLGYVSMGAGGDLRLHFKHISATKILFVAVGSHSQLYK